MELKRYQERALERLSEWFRCLEECDFSPARAWELMGIGGHVSRWDSSRRAIPHVCLKVPTGGGKTLLASEAMVRCNLRTGLVLWAVPNKAIFAQTKKALWSREHPYRVALERASGGRVKVLEKDDNLTKGDIDNYLCVMLLSLQAANRTNNKEFLKMFQEAGRHSSFFPDSDDYQRARTLLEQYSGLDTAEDGRILRTQANVFKLCRPVVVLDEAHKAYGRYLNEATFSQFDPYFVLELSATPDRSKSNVLVDVGGLDLKEEEMIKLPIHVTGHGEASWKDVLREAFAQLDELSSEAGLLIENGNRPIRPMAVVRVEVTGKKQFGGSRLHAETVRDFLVSTMGVPAHEVRVQSSETKELEGEDLLSDECRVRWIITKDALKEGWDCSFAYVLVLLDNTKAKTTVTQMMGRVLRQPYARATGMQLLDSCYIYCHNLSVDRAVEAVKKELQAEGFGDVASQIRTDKQVETVSVTASRRFNENVSRLPQVLHRTGGEIDYEQHILADIDWGKVSPPAQWNLEVDSRRRGGVTVDMEEEGMTTSVNRFEAKGANGREFDLAWYTRQLRGCIPNPWQASRLIEEAVRDLAVKGRKEDWIAARGTSFIRALEKHVLSTLDEQAEQVFKSKLNSGEITFDLNLPFEYTECYEVQAPKNEVPAAYQRTLFSPVYSYDMNNLEKKYAIVLDGNEAIKWWHRIAARQPGEYRLQGWRKDYVYPDFVALAKGDTIIVHETKGEHLRGSDDTNYKERLLACLQTQFNNSRATLTINSETATADFRILFEDDM